VRECTFFAALGVLFRYRKKGKWESTTGVNWGSNLSCGETAVSAAQCQHVLNCLKSFRELVVLMLVIHSWELETLLPGSDKVFRSNREKNSALWKLCFKTNTKTVIKLKYYIYTKKLHHFLKSIFNLYIQNYTYCSPKTPLIKWQIEKVL